MLLAVSHIVYPTDPKSRLSVLRETGVEEGRLRFLNIVDPTDIKVKEDSEDGLDIQSDCSMDNC